MPKSVDTTNDHWHQFTDSSNISGAGIQKGKLVVSFHKNGVSTGVYAYSTNDIVKGEGLCCRLAMATSKGLFVHQYIRDLPNARIS